MTEAPLVIVRRPQAAQVARAIKTSSGYTRGMSMRVRAQAVWFAGCMLSGVVAQYLSTPLH